MSKVAVIKAGGKQYQVREKDVLKVEKIDAKEGDKVNFDVLMTFDADGKNANIGTPLVEGVKVEAKVVEHGRAPKVRVVHYKNKTREHKVYGHRQPFTKVEVTKIS